MTQICVPLMVEDHSEALRDAILAAELGADLIEFRVDVFFEDHSNEETGVVELLQQRIDRVLDLVEVSPIPCIVTCRPHWEGGEYHGDDDERVALYEALGTSDTPPAYIDVELATYTRSANIRQKINLAVNHPKQVRTISTRLILSTHDFDGRPSDLTRKILTMQDEPACSVIKVAYRARSIRDNLELFELLRDANKPTIALGMGEFGQMSRILAPKFGGFITFASLKYEANTAPGQITIAELIHLYRFRSIKPSTKVYGIIGWPVTQSLSPMVHNAGFEQIGWDGVYVPMPVEGSYESFKATTAMLITMQDLNFEGASVTIPHKENLLKQYPVVDYIQPRTAIAGSANTLCFEFDEYVYENSHVRERYNPHPENTDSSAMYELIRDEIEPTQGKTIMVFGAGGAAKGVLAALRDSGATVFVTNRNCDRAQELVREQTTGTTPYPITNLFAIEQTEQENHHCDLYINCTPVGMADGPDPDGLSIPIPNMDNLSPETVFFDTVYNPIETPMLKAAKERGYRTIDGVQMFVKQAEAQFEIWTDQTAPDGLFDQIVRNKLTSAVTDESN